MAAAAGAVSAPTAVLNPLLSCGLCKGYLRDPHTFCECLHTYCKVCLVRHMFEKGTHCPECAVELHCDPLATGAVKADQTLRGVIDKLLPAAARAEEAAPGTPAAGGEAAEVTLDALLRARRRVTINSDAAEQCQYMVLSLARRDEEQPILPRPFLRTLAALQLQDLRAYIAQRLVRASTAADGRVQSTPAPCRPEQVLLFVNGAPVMGREHTLQFVVKTQWRRDADLVMQYAVSP